MRLILIVVNCFISFCTFSQVDKLPKISLGLSHRNAIIRLEDKLFTTRPSGYSFNSLEHSRVTSLTIDISRNIWNKHWHLQLANYFRYGHVVYEQNRQNVRTNEIKRIKHDHVLDMLYKFNSKKPKRPVFVLGVGIGIMNAGTKFQFDYNTGEKDVAGNWIYRQRTRSFQFTQPRLLIGIERRNVKNPKNSLNAYVIVHASPDEDFESFASFWPEIKMTYSFSPFKKRKIN
jgi:hypothetical protein